ncbi:MAG TPA: LysR family transcriptional regulator [Caulobacteraceae bacterium]|nr:LysR family transcriptional regulator [Caulobacteraceae bacterium]
MLRDGLADLTVFVTVADHLSFKVAASRLGLTPSAISHSMRQLEERLGVRLLNRTTRSVSLTDAGVRLLERLRPAIEEIGNALDDLNQERSRPYGRLRIYATHLAAVAVIAPIWRRFLTTYPDVHLEVDVDEAAIDVVSRGFDAGVGPQDRASTDMIAVRVTGPLKLAVVGASSYFAKHSPPRTPDDLARHHCIQSRRDPDGGLLDWPFERDGEAWRLPVQGRVTVSNNELALRAAVDGLGIACTIEGQAEPFLRSGHLVRVLEDWLPEMEGLFLYYSGHRQVPAALRALIDMIRASDTPSGTRNSLENPFAAIY